MNYNTLPQWSKSALNSLGLVYRELQDIEIYVEDTDSEALYCELLTRATDYKIKIKKIICLNGRLNVVDKCKNYSEKFPALFIIDGDLQLLHGEKEEKYPRLYQHDLYCVENYLFCPDACVQILLESSGKLLEEDVVRILDWDNFLNQIKEPLIKLFIIFAISWKLFPQEKTVSHGFYKLSRQVSKRRGPELCENKVDKLVRKLRLKIIDHCNLANYQETTEIVTEEISSSNNSIKYISGKDFLLPILYFHLKYKGLSSNTTMDSLKFRLARHYNKEKIKNLGNVIVESTSGKIYQAI